MANKQVASRDALSGAQPRVFSLTEANRSLVLVRRIVADIVANVARLMDLRNKREELSRAVPIDDQIQVLQRESETIVAKLNSLQAELTEIGVELKDWESGLVDFPGLHEGRKVWLCWKLGEEGIAFWHEHDEGFRGRKAITPAFE